MAACIKVSEVVELMSTYEVLHRGCRLVARGYASTEVAPARLLGRPSAIAANLLREATELNSHRGGTVTPARKGTMHQLSGVALPVVGCIDALPTFLYVVPDHGLLPNSNTTP